MLVRLLKDCKVQQGTIKVGTTDLRIVAAAHDGGFHGHQAAFNTILKKFQQDNQSLVPGVNYDIPDESLNYVFGWEYNGNQEWIGVFTWLRNPQGAEHPYGVQFVSSVNQSPQNVEYWIEENDPGAPPFHVVNWGCAAQDSGAPEIVIKLH